MRSVFKASLQAILLSTLLTGCFSFENEDLQSPDDRKSAMINAAANNAVPQTEAYIDLVEQEVSKAVSGLKAATEGLDIPDLNKLALEVQIDRLSGVSKPTVKYLEDYQKALRSGDELFFKRDRDDAFKVDGLTSAKWADAEKAKKQLAEANARAEAAEKTLLDMQSKETMEAIRKYFLAGGAVFTLLGGGALMAGMWFAMSGLKKAGAVGLAIGTSLMALPIFLPTVFMQDWFSYSVGGIILLSLAYTAWSFRRGQSHLTK